MAKQPTPEEVEASVALIARMILHAENPELSTVERLEALETAVSQIALEFIKLRIPTDDYIRAIVAAMVPTVRNGEAPSAEDLIALIEPLIPVAKPGPAGKTPIAGIDYLSREQGIEIIKALIPPARLPQLGVDYVVPTTDEIVQACLQLMSGLEYAPAGIFRALFDAPNNVINAINGGTSQIKAERIEGLEHLIDEVRKKNWPPFRVGTAGGPAAASTSGSNVADELVTAVQDDGDVTIDLAQLSHTYVVVLQVRRNGIPQVRGTSWTQTGGSVRVPGADASEFFELQYTYAS